MDIRHTEIDYAAMELEKVGINPYELVIAVAKEARKINQKAQKYLGPDVAVKPVNLALLKLAETKTDFEYVSEEAAAATDREAHELPFEPMLRPAMPRSVSQFRREPVVEEHEDEAAEEVEVPEIEVPEVGEAGEMETRELVAAGGDEEVEADVEVEEVEAVVADEIVTDEEVKVVKKPRRKASKTVDAGHNNDEDYIGNE